MRSTLDKGRDPSLLLLKKNSLITSPRSSFRAALHLFFPTSIPRLFTFKPSPYFFVLACRRHTSIHLLPGIMTAARIWPSQGFTLYLWSILLSSLTNVQD